MSDTKLRQRLVGLGERCGLGLADAEDIAITAMEAISTRATRDREKYAKQVVRNLAKKPLAKASRSDEFFDDAHHAPHDQQPDRLLEARNDKAEQRRTIIEVDAAIEQFAFWGDDGASGRIETDDADLVDAEAVLRELQYYERVLAGLTTYGDRHSETCEKSFWSRSVGRRSAHRSRGANQQNRCRRSNARRSWIANRNPMAPRRPSTSRSACCARATRSCAVSFRPRTVAASSARRCCGSAAGVSVGRRRSRRRCSRESSGRRRAT